MSATPATNPVKKHRREVWLFIVGPVALALLVLVALCVAMAVAVATGSMEDMQITTAMGVVATLFVLFPLTLVCLVPYFVMAVLAAGAGQAYAHGRGPLRATRRLTRSVADQTNQHAPRLARPLIGLNVRMARWEHRLRGWRQPLLRSGEETADEGS